MARLTDPSKEEKTGMRIVKKAKIYTDEDIEEEVVDWIRSHGVNIKSARDVGFEALASSLPKLHKFVEFSDDGFWTYDVGLDIFLKHLIDGWLVEAISD
ncbi:MAG: hypothetical protein J2P41_03140 [Blastocatellia bacterium]|nr:hypothetical protein [Blastocatellia bacterium]